MEIDCFACFQQEKGETTQKGSHTRHVAGQQEQNPASDQGIIIMEISADDLRPKDKAQVEAYIEHSEKQSNVGRKVAPRKLIRTSFGRASQRLEAAKNKRKEGRSEKKRQYREVRRLTSENMRMETSVKLATARNEKLKDQVRQQKIEFHRRKQELEDELQQLKFVKSAKERQAATLEQAAKENEAPAIMRLDFAGQIEPNGSDVASQDDSFEASLDDKVDDGPATSKQLSDEPKVIDGYGLHQMKEEEFPSQ